VLGARRIVGGLKGGMGGIRLEPDLGVGRAALGRFVGRRKRQAEAPAPHGSEAGNHIVGQGLQMQRAVGAFAGRRPTLHQVQPAPVRNAGQCYR
jgi:hypothetical protein